MTIHYLKTVQPYYDSVVRGEKPFEVRKNDRNFRIDDIVCLREYVNNWNLPDDNAPHEFSGREIFKIIIYISDYDQRDGFVVFAMRNLNLTEEMDLQDLIEKEALERFDLLVEKGFARVLASYLGSEVVGEPFKINFEEYPISSIIKACDEVEARL